MAILVTGGTGYIGSHTVVELLNNNYDVVIVDNYVNSKPEVLNRIFKITGKKPRFYEVDCTNYEKLKEVFQKEKITDIIHFAGLKSVAESVTKPQLYIDNNIGSSKVLLRLMSEFNVTNIVFSSSATVYGVPDHVPLKESDKVGGCTNPYGQTKLDIEYLLKDYAKEHKEANIAILRYFNPIGAHESGLIGEDPNGIPNNLMPIIMRVAEGRIDKLHIYGDDYPTADGTCRRDYIHVVDLAKGHVAAIEHMKNGVEIYNLGTGTPTSVKEMVAAFEKASGKELPCEITGRRAGDLAEMWANADKAKRELGWQTTLTVDDAMRDTINYLNKVKE
jgi:UDP-glucose 4-epimerase